MLLKNLDVLRLYNAARLNVKSLMPYIIETIILIGFAKRDDVFIWRTSFISADMPFQFKRLQFLARFFFAMSINKPQG
jgi:hypothetical protein